MIKNLAELRKNNTREAALTITEAGLEAVDTEKVFMRDVRFEDGTLFIKEQPFSLEGVKNVFVVGVGKCVAGSVMALEKILGDRIAEGIAVDICESPELQKLTFLKGTHPFPSEANKNASIKIISLLEKAGEDDFIIFIVSGGGSTILQFSPETSPAGEKVMLECLFGAGAEIEEINTVRKHLSLARGGYLAKYAYPAKGVSLIFSDVPSNDFQFIASGPTVKDETTIEDAERIIEKYDIANKCSIGRNNLFETPKEDKYFENIKNILFVSNEIALAAMKEKAEELGFEAEVKTDSLSGEAKDVGKEIIRELHEVPPGSVLLYGGETTVTIENDGKGGRNQELVLSALPEIRDGELIISIDSDGRDNTEHAGALGDMETRRKAEELGIDPEKALKQNDSFAFFEKTGDRIETGITGSNVSDLIIAVKGK